MQAGVPLPPASRLVLGDRTLVQIVTVGVRRKPASVDLLERLSVAGEEVTEVLVRLRESVAEAFILSTCNRVELYALCGHEETGADILRQFLAERGGVSLQVLREASCVIGDDAAVRHALAVASGLDSMVVGEREILGQMRRALEGARRAGSLGPVLDRLGSAALACGKRVRSCTALGTHAESVASIAARLAERRNFTLAGARVVVLGAGEMAALALRHLAPRVSTRMTIVNRTLERGAALAAAYGAHVRPWSELEDAISEAELVVACTAAPVPILDAPMLRRARAAADKALLCLDLGVPRSIDRSVASIPGVVLVDMDCLGAEAAQYREERTQAIAHAERIVAEESERYMEWYRGRRVAPTIARLHAHAGAIGDAELARALARLPELSPRARAVVGELAARIVAKLLHEPTLVLKRDPEAANLSLIVERLFGILKPDLTEQGTPEDTTGQWEPQHMNPEWIAT